MIPSSRRTTAFRRILGSAFVVLLSGIAFLSVEIHDRYRFDRIRTTNPYAAERLQNVYSDAVRMGLVSDVMEKGASTYRLAAATAGGDDSGGAVFTTTSRGFRGPDHPVPKPPGKFRIVCLGASTTVEGARDETTYPALLEKELNSRFHSDRIEVVNCGVSGLTSELQRANLEAYLREEPDLVIEYFGANDICWLLVPYWERSWHPVQALAAHSSFLVTHFDHWFVPAPAEIERDQWRSTMMNLDYLYQTFKHHRIDFLLCTFARPALESCNSQERAFLEYNMRGSWNTAHLTFATYCAILDGHNRNLRKYADARGITLIPVAEELSGTLDIFMDTCHLRDNGIARKTTIIAGHVESFLRGKWNLPPGQPLEPDRNLHDNVE